MKNEDKPLEVFVSTADIRHMLKAQKRGFLDVSEMYGYFWLDKKDALLCGRAVYKKFLLVPASK